MDERVRFACVVACVVVFWPGVSSASPWTLPQHELVLSTDFGFSTADSEYMNDGERQLYPLRGKFESASLGLGVRYGFTDKFEMEARATFKQVSYKADPVILEISPFVESTDDGPVVMDGQTQTKDDATLEQIRGSVIDFGSTQLGAADLDVAARYNLYRGPILVTPQLSAKIPLGYQGPRGTFDELKIDDPTITVGDDVTLGDGQVDVAASLLLGTYLPWTRTFVRADVGYNMRFGEPGDQLVGSAKAGQFLTDRLIVFGGVRFAETLFEGESIGDTFVDNNPSQTARDYRFTGNVEIQELFLDRNFVTVEVGAIVNLDEVEMQVVYTDVIDGRNYADLGGISLAVVTSIPDATRQGGEELEPTEEVEVIEEVILVPINEAEDVEPEPEPEPVELPNVDASGDDEAEEPGDSEGGVEETP